MVCIGSTVIAPIVAMGTVIEGIRQIHGVDLAHQIVNEIVEINHIVKRIVNNYEPILRVPCYVIPCYNIIAGSKV